MGILDEISALDLFTSVGDAMIIVSSGGTIEVANDEAHALFRYPQGGLAGLPVEDLMPEEARERHRVLLRAYFAAPTTREMGRALDIVALCADGTEFPADIKLGPVKGQPLTVATVRDKTHRKELAEVRALKAELEARNAEVEAKNRRLEVAVEELQTPVLPVADGVVACSLRGVVDSMRANKLREALLEGVRTHEASVVVLDLAGISTIDTSIAAEFEKTVRAVGLLGSSAVFSGMRPAVADTCSSMGIDFEGIRCFSTLRAALKACTKQGAPRP